MGVLNTFLLTMTMCCRVQKSNKPKDCLLLLPAPEQFTQLKGDAAAVPCTSACQMCT